jgi:gliding motility-associated protein GldL
METPAGAKITGYAFGFGASIVIVGALFKIQHWPGASVMLTAGMGTEAILFAITAFGKPHKTYHWETVFPQLHSDEQAAIGEDEMQISSSGVSSVGGSGLQSMGSLPSLSEEDVQKLSQGIAKLSETAGKISDLSSLGSASSSLVQNLNAASDSVASFNNTQVQINASSQSLISSYKGISENLSTAQESSGTFIAAMKDVNKNLSAINSIYEIQLKTVGDQSESIKATNAEMDKVRTAISSSLTDLDTFKSQSSKLAQNVSSLNAVYGSMLNAMSI